MQYYQAFTRAEQTAQACRILDALIANQLVFGGPVVVGPAKFLWNVKDSERPRSTRRAGVGRRGRRPHLRSEGGHSASHQKL